MDALAHELERLRTRVRALVLLGATTAAAGGLESLVVLRLGLPSEWAWLQSVFYALAGLALVTAGLVVRRRERASP
jgi:hypothetical protein